MRSNRIEVVTVCFAVCFCCVASSDAQTARTTNYRGWKAIELSNGLVEVQVVPDIGGRVIQYKLGDFEYFFVNGELAGKQPPPTGLGPDGEWLNYGGEKLWPAPQGWDNKNQWPGPPDAVLDGSPHHAVILDKSEHSAAVRLTSRKDARSGIQFSRTLRVFPDSSRIGIEARMTNIDTKPRRWGIWSVVQQDAAERDGEGHEKKLRVYCPINPESVFPNGYQVMFGLANNLSWQPDARRRMMRVHYQRRVGKIGMDCSAGWVATVNGSAGRVFVQRFPYFPDRVYPDRSSVEIWLHGLGQFIVDGKMDELDDDPLACPYFIETELLSPLATVKPGESYTFRYDWYSAVIGGDYPVLDCTDVGVVCAPFVARVDRGKLLLSGRFGVFHRATVGLVFRDGNGKPLSRSKSLGPVTPSRPLVFSPELEVAPPPKDAATVELVIYDKNGRALGSLARADLQLASVVTSMPIGRER